MDPDQTLASDAEREEVVARLRTACEEGRLTLEELTERAEAAYTARTRGQLARVTDDLPETTAAPPVAAAGPPQRRFTAVMGDVKRSGRLSLEERIGATALMGDVELDLREAYFPASGAVIQVLAVMGDVIIFVPEGVRVELDAQAMLGGKNVDVAQARPGAPSLRIQGYAIMGDIKVSNTPRRKGFLRSLLGE